MNKHSTQLITLHVKFEKKIHKINIKYENQIRHTEHITHLNYMYT